MYAPASFAGRMTVTRGVRTELQGEAVSRNRARSPLPDGDLEVNDRCPPMLRPVRSEVWPRTRTEPHLPVLTHCRTRGVRRAGPPMMAPPASCPADPHQPDPGRCVSSRSLPLEIRATTRNIIHVAFREAVRRRRYDARLAVEFARIRSIGDDGSMLWPFGSTWRPGAAEAARHPGPAMADRPDLDPTLVPAGHRPRRVAGSTHRGGELVPATARRRASRLPRDVRRPRALPPSRRAARRPRRRGRTAAGTDPRRGPRLVRRPAVRRGDRSRHLGVRSRGCADGPRRHRSAHRRRATSARSHHGARRRAHARAPRRAALLVSGSGVRRGRHSTARVLIGEHRTDDRGRIGEFSIPENSDGRFTEEHVFSPGIPRMQGAVRWGDRHFARSPTACAPVRCGAGRGRRWSRTTCPSRSAAKTWRSTSTRGLLWSLGEHPWHRVVRGIPFARLGIEGNRRRAARAANVDWKGEEARAFPRLHRAAAAGVPRPARHPLVLLPIFREYWWLAAIFAALIA